VSPQVSLGIVLHNKNKGEEMVKIVSHMQQYVPALNCSDVTYIPSLMQRVATPEVVFHKKLFGGNQLTAARIRGAQMAKSNRKTALNRLDGVIPVVEDWHTEVLRCVYTKQCYLIIMIRLGCVEVLL